MSGDAKPSPIEGMLLTRLAGIERQIADLERERYAIQRLITKVRHENLTGQGITRKNSFDRIIAETAILAVLRREVGNKNRGFVRAGEVQNQIRHVVVNIKDVTFRTYLHRMKEKGLIEQSYPRGSWRLVKEPETESGEADSVSV